MDALNQKLIDQTMIELDGTESKTNLGANAMLGVSLAVLKAGAKFKKEELYAYLGNKKILPRCMMNILNGGAHAENKLEFQEFMIIPSKEEYLDNLRMGAEVFHSLQKILKEKGLSCGVGDEGGFAPSIDNTKEALDLIQEAIEKDQKYGNDLQRACSLNEDGEFTIPLNDPIQSIRIQQVINSIIIFNEFQIIDTVYICLSRKTKMS